MAQDSSIIVWLLADVRKGLLVDVVVKARADNNNGSLLSLSTGHRSDTVFVWIMYSLSTA